MIGTLLGMAAVYIIGAGLVALLGMAMQFDKNKKERTR
jgi:hypothetical protein